MGFLDDLKSDYLFAPGERDLKGLLKSTALNVGANTAGRYVYYKFLGDYITKYIGTYFGTYANIASSAIYATALNLLGAKFVSNPMYSSLIQAAGAVPLADYLATLLGDPMGSPLVGASNGSALSQEAMEEAEVRALAGGAPSVSLQSVRGY